MLEHRTQGHSQLIRMTSTQNQQSYFLLYRRDDVDQERRLDFQQDVIKHAIVDDN